MNTSLHSLKAPPRLCVKLLSSIFVAVCAFSWLSLLIGNVALLRAREPDAPRFASEIAAFEKDDHQNAVPHDCILFVGSSTIRLWQTADAFSGLPVVNRGFGGSTIADVNYYFDRIVAKYAPRTIVFYSGDNDIAAGRSPNAVVGDFQTFMTRTHEKLPDTRIIFLSVKPSPLRWQMWPKMQEVNARVQALSEKNDYLTYVDTAPTILGEGGEPRKDLFRDDGLHMNEKGYEAWNKLLAPHLK